jgi:hypothetical protein
MGGTVMKSSRPRRRAFLLRCWEAPGTAPLHPYEWRFSLEEAGTGEQHGFPTLEALMDFVGTALEGSAHPALPESVNG